MAQNLLQISQEAFRLQLFKISSKSLVDLIRQIYEIKTEYGHIMTNDEAMDLERKETKINFELMRRGYLNKKEYENYFPWLKKINSKKRTW